MATKSSKTRKSMKVPPAPSKEAPPPAPNLGGVTVTFPGLPKDAWVGCHVERAADGAVSMTCRTFTAKEQEALRTVAAEPETEVRNSDIEDDAEQDDENEDAEGEGEEEGDEDAEDEEPEDEDPHGPRPAH